MGKKYFQIIIVSVIVFSGFIIGLYSYTMHGVVSVKTIHIMQQKCLQFQNASRVSCLRRELSAIVRPTNIPDIMHAVLMDTYHADDSDTVYNSPNCHVLAHLVGETAGNRPYASTSRLFAMCGTACVYGCVHGMFFGLLKQGKLTRSTLARVCDTDSGSQSTSLDREECIHGIGHGIADYLHEDIPSAVSYCDAFETLADKKICWDGLFIQIYGPVVQIENTSKLPEDLFADCRQYPIVVRRICMESVLSVELSVVKDIGLASGVCDKSLHEVDECIDPIESMQSINISLEQSVNARCKQAEKAVYACTDAFVATTNNDAQIEEACATNGIVHRDACLAYMKQQRFPRRTL